MPRRVTAWKPSLRSRLVWKRAEDDDGEDDDLFYYQPGELILPREMQDVRDAELLAFLEERRPLPPAAAGARGGRREFVLRCGSVAAAKAAWKAAASPASPPSAHATA